MENKLPEAPVTMFTNYKRADGFEVSVTLRGSELEEVAGLLNKTIERIIKANGTPVSRSNGFSKPQVPTKPCSIHKTDMKEKVSKTGIKFFSHSRGTYPDFEYCNGKGFPSEQQEEVPERQVEDF